MKDLIEALNRAHELDEAAFSGGYAEGGSLDTAKRLGGSTKGSGTNFKALDGKKTRTVKAKDLKPGMITDTGKILKVTNVGWVNGKPSVEVSYGGIGNRGSYASDTVAADRDYQVLDESLNESRYGHDEIDDIISFLQDYNNGSKWDEFCAEFADVDESDLDADDVLTWMQNDPDMYDAYLSATDNDYLDD